MNVRNFSTKLLVALVIATSALSITPSASWSQSPPESTKCNCVFYARWRVPSLPFGITTYKAKLAIRNVKSSDTPRKNDVAIINSGSSYYDKKLGRVVTGHVAVVEDVKNGIITISESNWNECVFQPSRKGTAKDLKIDGYFRP